MWFSDADRPGASGDQLIGVEDQYQWGTEGGNLWPRTRCTSWHVLPFNLQLSENLNTRFLDNKYRLDLFKYKMQQSKKSRDTNGSSQKSLEQILHRRLRILEEHNKFVIKQQPVSCKESEERLSHLINETKYRLKLLEASVCHLGYLVNEDDDALRELQEGVTFFSGGCAKKMCWMQDIEDRLHIFQGAEKGNLHLLETTKFWHMIRYAFVYFWKDIEKRLQLFLETNDTIWLLFDSKFLRRIRVRNVSKCTIWPVNDYLELLLIHVRNCLRLPQDRDGWLPKQPLDEETKLRLRHKFHVKLDVWKVRADKLRRLLGKLEDLRKYWPQQYQVSTL